MGHFYDKNLSGYCEILVLRVCGARQNFYVDLDDRIYECLIASVVAMQAEDVLASFLFVAYALLCLAHTYSNRMLWRGAKRLELFNLLQGRFRQG